MMTRKPYVADKFYDGDEKRLKKQIEESFLGKFGPMEFPSRDFSSEKKLKAVIVPHAGYFYSGQCAAHAYKDIAECSGEEPENDVYLILAPNHSGNGYTSLTTEDYETPLGIVEIEKEFAGILIKNGMRDDPESHRYEHSLEVQLPFLQYITNNECKIVPIILTGEMNARRLSAIIVSSIKEFEEKTGKNVIIIVSSDFTHYGRAYGYRPFTPAEALAKIEEQDNKAADLIAALDIPGFNKFLEDTSATICGALPIITLMYTLRGLGKYEGELLCYYRSSQIVPDKDNSVSYCAISFFEYNGNSTHAETEEEFDEDTWT